MLWILLLSPPVAVAIVLVALERWRGAPPTDWFRNLEIWGLSLLVTALVLPHLHTWGLPALLVGAHLPFWVGFLVFLVVMDLGEFLFHIAQHRIPFLWAMHALHHSDPEMSALTVHRHFWGDQLIKQVTIWSAAAVIISPTPAIASAYATVTLWHYVVHSNLRIDLGRWSWLINVPAYHRRHHSKLRAHYDSNFASLFPIFDVVMGSYYRPDGYPETGMETMPTNIVHAALWPLLWDRPARPASAPRETARA